jgi:hypothetical protein
MDRVPPDDVFAYFRTRKRFPVSLNARIYRLMKIFLMCNLKAPIGIVGGKRGSTLNFINQPVPRDPTGGTS